MSFDALTAHAIRDELARTIQGGRVQRVVMLGALAFGIEVYAHRRRWELLVSVEPSAPRVHLATGALVRASDETPPWLLLLRKYVKDGVIEAITQPRLERVITLHVAKRDDDGRVQRTRLIIEVMGRHSNAVLVDEGGRVLDAVRRAPPSV
ncbi:MAG TPA: NFACT family protein, partial [Chloroflexota bacterium]